MYYVIVYVNVYNYSINLFNSGVKKCNIKLFFFVCILHCTYVHVCKESKNIFVWKIKIERQELRKYFSYKSSHKWWRNMKERQRRLNGERKQLNNDTMTVFDYLQNKIAINNQYWKTSSFIMNQGTHSEIVRQLARECYVALSHGRSKSSFIQCITVYYILTFRSVVAFQKCQEAK